MIKYLRRLNEALPMLIATILVYGLLVEGIGVWWVEDKLRYTTGLLIGIGLALFLSINIASSIWSMMDVQGKKGQAMIAVKAVLRYFVVVAVSMTMGYFRLGNIATWFIGVMGLKVAAFLQPLIHKFFFGKSLQDESNA
jgi:hypothetical protein